MTDISCLIVCPHHFSFRHTEVASKENNPYLCRCARQLTQDLAHAQRANMHLRYKKILTYLVVFASTLLLAWILPNRHLPMWQWWLEAIVYSGLFALLVWLSCRLVRSGRGAGETAITALFLLFFLPRGGGLVNLSIESVTYLASQCMVPFFIGQYMRIRRRDYGHIYVLMILMGIFCSYTHDGIAIPLCGGFLWMSWLTREEFFKRACWPMVIGFCIGTGLCLWQALSTGRIVFPSGLDQTISQTTLALQTLWDTKIFLLSLFLTAWLTVNRWGRQLLLHVFRQQMLLSLCTLFSLFTMPFAPLGLEQAVDGVCFFCLFWTLLLLRQLADRYYYKPQSK